MKAIDAVQLSKIANFLKGMNTLSAETGVNLATINPWLEIDGQDVGELDWRQDSHNGATEYLLREHSV